MPGSSTLSTYLFNIFIDFITYLPLSKGFDAILVVVDRLIKLRYYIPYYNIDGSEELARLFIKYVIIYYSLPETIISD